MFTITTPRRRKPIALALRLTTIMVLASAGCGATKLPPRGVIETDIESWQYRRFQRMLDPEIGLARSSAQVYSATYVHRRAIVRGHIELSDRVHAVVTRFERDEGTSAAVARFARRLGEYGYEVDPQEVDGQRVLTISGRGEAWILWSARGHALKIGARDIDRVPTAIVARYLQRYPSTLVEFALEEELALPIPVETSL